MSVLSCRTAPRVKTTRTAPRHAERFGAGILRALPFAGTMPFTAADEAEFIQYRADRDARDRRMERLAAESRDLDRLCGSFCL